MCLEIRFKTILICIINNRTCFDRWLICISNECQSYNMLMVNKVGIFKLNVWIYLDRCKGHRFIYRILSPIKTAPILWSATFDLSLWQFSSRIVTCHVRKNLLMMSSLRNATDLHHYKIQSKCRFWSSWNLTDSESNFNFRFNLIKILSSILNTNGWLIFVKKDKTIITLVCEL